MNYTFIYLPNTSKEGKIKGFKEKTKWKWNIWKFQKYIKIILLS